MLIAFLLGSIEYTLILIYYISFYLACDRESYTSETGTIKYPSSGNYEPNLNCFFRITVAEGKRVKITFLENFDFASGTFIENLRFSNIPKPDSDGKYSTSTYYLVINIHHDHFISTFCKFCKQRP